MKPGYKYAGQAGIAAGILLILEFVLFMASGFTPDKLVDPSGAITLVQDKETLLRAATFLGVAGALARILYVAGLASKLHAKTPSKATAVLYFGVLGSIGHGLVALSFYLGLPALVKLAAEHLPEAVSSWGAFLAITNGFQGLGNLLLGLMLLLAGWAIIAKSEMSKGLGWVGVVAGSAAILGVMTTATPLAAIGFAVFIPSIILAATFDIWAGRRLLKTQDN